MWANLFQHRGSSQVRQKSVLEKFEEELPILDSVDSLQEEGHALLVVGDQARWEVGRGSARRDSRHGDAEPKAEDT